MTAQDDLPAPQGGVTNSLAIDALVGGLIGILFPPACFVAIILGHRARRQIRRTGERGCGVATTGLILGYLIIAMWLVALIGVAIVTRQSPLALR